MKYTSTYAAAIIASAQLQGATLLTLNFADPSSVNATVDPTTEIEIITGTSTGLNQNGNAATPTTTPLVYQFPGEVGSTITATVEAGGAQVGSHWAIAADPGSNPSLGFTEAGQGALSSQLGIGETITISFNQDVWLTGFGATGANTANEQYYFSTSNGLAAINVVGDTDSSPTGVYGGALQSFPITGANTDGDIGFYLPAGESIEFGATMGNLSAGLNAIQLYTDPAGISVPEPSSALLTVMASLGFMARRRRA